MRRLRFPQTNFSSHTIITYDVKTREASSLASEGRLVPAIACSIAVANHSALWSCSLHVTSQLGEGCNMSFGRFVFCLTGWLVKVEEVWSVFTDFIEARSIFETFFGQRVCRRARKPRTTMKAQASCPNKAVEEGWYEDEVMEWFSSF